MDNKYLDSLKTLFTDEAPSKEKVLGLMDETMSFFRQIKTKLESGDPEKQKEAFEDTMEMKQILESKMQGLAEKTGLNLTELAALAENMGNMSPEEQSAIQEAQNKLHQIQEEETKKHIKIIG